MPINISHNDLVGPVIIKKKPIIYTSNKNHLQHALTLFDYNNTKQSSDNMTITNNITNDMLRLRRLSGSEPIYDPHKWNDNERIKRTHNCYSYIFESYNCDN